MGVKVPPRSQLWLKAFERPDIAPQVPKVFHLILHKYVMMGITFKTFNILRVLSIEILQLPGKIFSCQKKLSVTKSFCRLPDLDDLATNLQHWTIKSHAHWLYSEMLNHVNVYYRFILYMVENLLSMLRGHPGVRKNYGATRMVPTINVYFIGQSQHLTWTSWIMVPSMLYEGCYYTKSNSSVKALVLFPA